MSVKAMGIVWEANLPQREKFVLLAYADHADHAGNNVFPSVGMVAWKTGYEPRSIQRITKVLVEKGILIPVGLSQYQTKRYKINFDAIPQLPPYLGGDSLSSSRYGGDSFTQVGGDISGEGGDKSGLGGDIAESPKPSFKPSFKKQERGAIAGSAFGDQTPFLCEKLYQQVTLQPSIPANDQRDQAIANLTVVLDYYGQDIEKAAAEGREIFAAWCSTRGKNGNKYSPVNVAWIGTKWLEALAPQPFSREVDTSRMTPQEYTAYLEAKMKQEEE